MSVSRCEGHTGTAAHAVLLLRDTAPRGTAKRVERGCHAWHHWHSGLMRHGHSFELSPRIRAGESQARDDMELGSSRNIPGDRESASARSECWRVPRNTSFPRVRTWPNARTHQMRKIEVDQREALAV